MDHTPPGRHLLVVPVHEEDAAREASEWEAREQEERIWERGRRRRGWEGSDEAMADAVFLFSFQFH